MDTVRKLLYLYSLEHAKEDKRGFNFIDRSILESMSMYYITHRRLSTKQMDVVERRLKKYHRQLAAMGDFNLEEFLERRLQLVAPPLFIED